MGWKSTINLTREEALARIEEALTLIDLHNLSNERLSEILEILQGDEEGANYSIADP